MFFRYKQRYMNYLKGKRDFKQTEIEISFTNIFVKYMKKTLRKFDVLKNTNINKES